MVDYVCACWRCCAFSSIVPDSSPRAELHLCIVLLGAIVASIQSSVSETDKQPAAMVLLLFYSFVFCMLSLL